MFAGKLLRQTGEQKVGLYELPRRLPERKRDSDRRKRNLSGVEAPSKPIDGTLGCRYELKYRISEPKAEAIEQFIKPYLNLDRYCKLQPSGAYPIVTLYLDSDDLQLCRESMEGRKNRFKLRIRSYTDDPDYPRFFEIKRRMNAIIIKDRHRVIHRDVATFLSGSSLPLQSYNNDGEMLRQFQLYMNSINARPVIRVRYVRRAYEDGSYNRVRVTFDRQLAYNVGIAPKVSFNSQGWQHYSLNGVILEIKFTALYPAWLGGLVKFFGLRQQSMSKYVSSVKQSCSLKFCAPRLSV